MTNTRSGITYTRNTIEKNKDFKSLSLRSDFAEIVEKLIRPLSEQIVSGSDDANEASHSHNLDSYMFPEEMWLEQKMAQFFDELPPAFEASKAIQNIKKLPHAERRTAMENIHTEMRLQQESIENILEAIRTELNVHDFTNVSQKEISSILSDFIGNMKSDFARLTREQRAAMFDGIKKYMHQKLDMHVLFHKYHEDPVAMLREIYSKQEHNIDWNRLHGKVYAEIDGANIVFYVDPSEFAMIGSFGKNNVASSAWAGFYYARHKIIVMNGNKGDNGVSTALKHEMRHANNDFLFPEKETHSSSNEVTLDALIQKNLELFLWRWKDEIIAFFRWWTIPSKIKFALTTVYSKDYVSSIESREHADIIRSQFNTEIIRALNIAEKLVKQWVSLDILAVTPMKKWHQLKKVHTLQSIHQHKESSFPDGSYVWVQEFQNGISFRGKFTKDKILIEGIKDYVHFREEGQFDNTGKLVQWRIIGADGSIAYEWSHDNIAYGKNTIASGIFHKGDMVRWEIRTKKTTKIGVFKDDQLHWVGEEIWDDGYREEGIFENGELIEGKKLYDKSSSEEWIFQNGKLIRWESRFTDGSVYIWTFDVNGKLEGENGKIILKNGVIFEWKFQSGKLVQWKISYTEWNMIEEGIFNDYKLIEWTRSSSTGDVIIKNGEMVQ